MIFSIHKEKVMINRNKEIDSANNMMKALDHYYRIIKRCETYIENFEREYKWVKEDDPKNWNSSYLNTVNIDGGDLDESFLSLYELAIEIISSESKLKKYFGKWYNPKQHNLTRKK
tara:strand:- start:924 stop:1271 length:348 start_codon:yes stop_codon:yes gene_type:complete